jgi:hypothetical protein
MSNSLGACGFPEADDAVGVAWAGHTNNNSLSALQEDRWTGVTARDCIPMSPSEDGVGDQVSIASK